MASSKKYEIIRPKSIDDSAYADFEYLLRWMGRDGAEYWLMFLDAEIEHRISNEVINRDDEDTIQALIEDERRGITVTAQDLSLNDMDVIIQLFGNKFVERYKLDGTVERYAPDGNSYTYRLRQGRYEVSFRLIQPDLPVYR